MRAMEEANRVRSKRPGISAQQIAGVESYEVALLELKEAGAVGI